MPRWEGFVQCPGCGYDLLTGDGERGCAWGDRPYLPEDLDVFCPNRRFNFFTMQGNAQCGKPGVCDYRPTRAVTCRTSGPGPRPGAEPGQELSARRPKGQTATQMPHTPPSSGKLSV
jgi:hypothetical protein